MSNLSMTNMVKVKRRMYFLQGLKIQNTKLWKQIVRYSRQNEKEQTVQP